jgi:hypothetical protein
MPTASSYALPAAGRRPFIASLTPSAHLGVAPHTQFSLATVRKLAASRPKEPRERHGTAIRPTYEGMTMLALPPAFEASQSVLLVDSRHLREAGGSRSSQRGSASPATLCDKLHLD